MKIAFLAPAGAMHRYNGNFGKSLHYAPLTLTTLAALVPSELNAETKIYDETVDPIPLDLEADLICITCITGTSSRCYAYADYFRKCGITVVLGGVHPSLLPEESKAHADSVITGFAEQSFPRMLHDFIKNELKPFYHQEADFTLENRPMPMRSLLKPKGYITNNTMEIVRGCHLPCTFCAYPAAFGNQPYKRPIKEVIAEMEQLGKAILIPDVNLVTDRAYAIELFRAMIPLKKIWVGLATSSAGFDDELIELFRRSGCKGLLIGFESISQESQAFIHKGMNRVDKYEELMKKLHDAGILVQGCFAFGADDEDESVFERTVEVVLRAKIDLPRYAILTPFPKTEYYKQLEKEKRITEFDWAMYDVEHCVFSPKKMTPKQLEDGNIWAWNETYKYKGIAKRISLFRSIPLVALMTNLGYRNYADKLHYFTREVMTDNSDIPS